MKIGIIGSRIVGTTLAAGFLKSGHQVMVATRSPEKLREWNLEEGKGADIGTHEKTADFAELAVLATQWADDAARNAIRLAGASNLEGKTVIDVTNPLDFSDGTGLPKPALAYPDSAGKKVQEWLPGSFVVKAFNMITAAYMTSAELEEGVPDLFIAGNKAESKSMVADFARGWGWKVHDMGDIEQAYLLEALAMVWIRWGGLNNHWTHAFRLMMK